MKKLIRNKTFETNSSSCHSLTIDQSDNLLDTIIPDRTGVITLTGGNFGWEYEEYNDALTKANYVAALLSTMNEKWLFPKVEHIYDKCYQNVMDVIKEQTGCETVEFLCSSDWDSEYYSHIDHQSAEGVEDFEWMLDKEQIRQFIFNPKSILITDNDNK